MTTLESPQPPQNQADLEEEIEEAISDVTFEDDIAGALNVCKKHTSLNLNDEFSKKLHYKPDSGEACFMDTISNIDLKSLIGALEKITNYNETYLTSEAQQAIQNFVKDLISIINAHCINNDQINYIFMNPDDSYATEQSDISGQNTYAEDSN